jgi:hypothetical protein
MLTERSWNQEEGHMTEAVLNAYRDVERAMEQYNRVMLEHITSMRTSEGADMGKIERLAGSAKAMRDSSSIYLSYAKYLAYGMPESEEMVDDDIQG